MNELKIYWNRPSYFWYTDSDNKKRRYYPDFYLPDYNLYLDPKNNYLIKTDTDKINRATSQNNIIVVVISEKFITKSAIQELLNRNIDKNFEILI